MTDFILYTIMLLSGAALGIIFFGGLWLTIQYGMKAKYAGLWFLLSLLLRTTIVVAGFYFVTSAKFYPLLVCLGGFVISRIVITRLTGSLLKKPLIAPGNDD